MAVVVGEFGFGRVVGVGEYLLLIDSNLAEVAFSISAVYQGKGMGKRWPGRPVRMAFLGWWPTHVHMAEKQGHDQSVQNTSISLYVAYLFLTHQQEAYNF